MAWQFARFINIFDAVQFTFKPMRYHYRYYFAIQIKLNAFFPGDKIKYEVQLLGLYDNKIANFQGQALVGEKKKCEVEFAIAIVDKDQFSSKQSQ